MLSTFFLFVLGVGLQVVGLFLAGFNYLMPTEIASSVIYFFGYLNYFTGVFPMNTLLQAIGAIATFWVLMFAIRIFFNVILPLIPFVGTRITFFDKDTSSYTTFTENKKKYFGLF